MKMSDEDVVDRIRHALSDWADEEPVAEPTPRMLDEASPMMYGEVATGSPIGRRHSTWLVAAAAALVVVVGLAAFAATRSERPAVLVDVGPGPSGIVEIPLGRSFGVRGLEVTNDAVWVTSHWDAELYRVDPSTNEIVATFTIPSHIEGVRAVGDSLWLSRYEPNEVIRIDPVTGSLTTRLGFDSQPSMASDGTRLWVIADRGGEGLVVEIDPDTGEEIGQIPLDAPPGSATYDRDLGVGSLWVSNPGAQTVSRVDLSAGRVTTVIDVDGEPRGVLAEGGSIWVVVNKAGAEPVGSVVRIDPSSAAVTATIPTGRWINGFAAGDGMIWATNFDDGTVSVVDAESATVVATTPIGNRPGGVAIGHGSVWITPHRRNALVRIDPSLPLEAAAVPDLARSVDVGTGTVFVRCSGSGSPTVVLAGNQAEGVANAIVEARLSHETRVCAYEPVGIADPDEAGLGGPAATVSRDLAEALGAVGERGPFILVGEWLEGLDAQMFAATHRSEVAGLVMVNGVSADYLERLRALLPAEALDKFDQALGDGGELQWLDESSAQVAEVGDFGDLPLIVLSDPTTDPIVAASASDPILTVAESDSINQLLRDTRTELAHMSTAGRLIITSGQVITAADVVDAVMSLLR